VGGRYIEGEKSGPLLQRESLFYRLEFPWNAYVNAKRRGMLRKKFGKTNEKNSRSQKEGSAVSCATTPFSID